MRTGGGDATRGFRDAADSHRDHLGSETHVAPSVAAASVCLSVSPAVRQKATREAMEWDGVGAMHERASFMVRRATAALRNRS